MTRELAIPRDSKEAKEILREILRGGRVKMSMGCVVMNGPNANGDVFKPPYTNPLAPQPDAENGGQDE